MHINVQQNSGSIIIVCRSKSALWSSFIQWHKMWSGFRVLLELQIEIDRLAWGEMMACWLFSKQLWHLPVDQGKHQIILNLSFTQNVLKLAAKWKGYSPSLPEKDWGGGGLLFLGSKEYLLIQYIYILKKKQIKYSSFLEIDGEWT